MKLNLKGAWDSTIATLDATLKGFFDIATIIGVICLFVAIAMLFWQKKRGGGGNSQGTIYFILFGAVLAAPKVLIPFALGIIDFIANIVISLVNAAIK